MLIHCSDMYLKFFIATKSFIYLWWLPLVFFVHDWKSFDHFHRHVFGESVFGCLSRRNFSHYILMMFIMFSLVLLIAYDGKMFEFQQKEMRKPEVQSIEEMIGRNFTFYIAVGTSTVYKSMKIWKVKSFRYLNWVLNLVFFFHCGVTIFQVIL